MERIVGYCIDSDVLIDYLRGVEKARSFLLQAGEVGILYISVVSIVELYAGKEMREEGKRQRIERFMENFVAIPLSESIARRAGMLRRDYHKPFADMIIAASAREYHLPLVTRNIKHFQIPAEREGIKLLLPY